MSKDIPEEIEVENDGLNKLENEALPNPIATVPSTTPSKTPRSKRNAAPTSSSRSSTTL